MIRSNQEREVGIAPFLRPRRPKQATMEMLWVRLPKTERSE
jgi:hypothetical protein